MKIEKVELTNIIKQLKPIVPKLSEENLCSGILFENGWMKANNGVIEICIKVYTGLTDEKIVIPSNAFPLLESLPNGIITIEENDKSISIKTGNGSYRYAKINASTFNGLESFDTGNSFKIDVDYLKNIVKRGLFACTDKLKPPYNGTLLNGDGTTLDIVTCDGYNMTLTKINTSAQINVSVPCGTIRSIISADISGEIEISNNGKMIAIKADDYIIKSHLIAGTYLDYTKPFGVNNSQVVTVQKSDLITSCKRALLAIGNVATSPLIIKKYSDTEIALESNSSTSEFFEKVKYVGNLSDNFEIGVNAKYVVEHLSAIDSEQITISFNSAINPIIFENKDYKSLLLPVRIKKKSEITPND